MGMQTRKLPLLIAGWHTACPAPTWRRPAASLSPPHLPSRPHPSAAKPDAAAVVKGQPSVRHGTAPHHVLGSCKARPHSQ